MKSLYILDRPSKRFYSETHPFYRWKNQLKEQAIKVKISTDHRIDKVSGADFLIIHSRFFENGWQNIDKRTQENEDQLLNYLSEIKKNVGKVIWYDAADSTGSNDFPIIHMVDVFLKKQVLKNREYYCGNTEDRKLRIWLDERGKTSSFRPCPKEHLHKIKVGWNIGLNDFRYFGYKLSRLSNYLPYSLYPNSFIPVNGKRSLDLTFRGTVNSYTENGIGFQRNKVLQIISGLKSNIASGSPIVKSKYLKELRNSKVSISPFGWGEVCYRDFESFFSGAILIKPSMEHLDTFPNVFLPNQSYIPVSWNLEDLEEKLQSILYNYSTFKSIAENGQEIYKKAVDRPECFLSKLNSILSD